MPSYGQGGLNKKLIEVNVPKPKEVSDVVSQQGGKIGFADELLATQQEAIKTKAAAQVLGVDIGGSSSKNEESLATTIVTKSMDIQNKAVERMEAQTDKLKNELDSANEALGNMQYQLLGEKLNRIEEAQRKSDEAAKNAAAAGAPKDAFGYYQQVKGELEKLVASIPHSNPAPPQPSGMSEMTMIKLKEMDLENSRILHQIQADNERANREFQLKLAEFSENRELRKQEYEDKRRFRNDGMQGLTDIAAAISAGLASGKGSPSGIGEEVEEVVVPAKVAKTKVAATDDIVNTFKCEVCGGSIPIRQGQKTAKCSNPDCGAEYKVDF